MKVSDNHRDHYIDNVKAVLIILVVFGHIAMKFSYVPLVNSMKFLVYIFHMPCFVFVSGYLAKGAYKNGVFRSDKILSFLWLYLVFKVLCACCNTITGRVFDLELFRDLGAPWYLLCMLVWYLMIPFLKSIKPVLAISGSLIAGILVGYLDVFGETFASSRVFVYLPFFILGLYTSKEQLNRFRNRKKLQIAAVFLMSLLVIVFVTSLDSFNTYLKIIYGGEGYANIKELPSLLWGGVWRGGWYVISAIVSGSFLLIIPKKKMWISKYGARTLQIYMMHILVRNTLAGFGVFNLCKNLPDIVNIVLCFGGSFVLSILLGNAWLEKVFTVLSGGTLFKKILKS